MHARTNAATQTEDRKLVITRVFDAPRRPRLQSLERLVCTWAWEDQDGKPGHETLLTVAFAERDGKTTLTLRQAVFESVTSRDAHQDGWASGLDCLAEYLTSA
jgi:uncharacterized protein YndB with AHSA1/START domain